MFCRYYYFNIFIDELLLELKLCNEGWGSRIRRDLYNAFAYADDVTIMAASVLGLQKLIPVCQDYPKKWRFTFGIKKTRCITIGSYKLCDKPVWFLDDKNIVCVKLVYILGINFNDQGKADSHCTNRTTSSRRPFYGLSNVGMCQTSLSARVKSYLWKYVCSPSLLYGVKSLSLTEKDSQQLGSDMGSMIKQSLRLSKYSYHSHLIQAMNIEPVSHSINTRITKLQIIFCQLSISITVYVFMIKVYLHWNHCEGHITRTCYFTWDFPSGSLCQSENASCFSARQRYKKGSFMIIMINIMLFHDNFIKPWSAEYNLLRLLTCSF